MNLLSLIAEIFSRSSLINKVENIKKEITITFIVLTSVFLFILELYWIESIINILLFIFYTLISGLLLGVISIFFLNKVNLLSNLKLYEFLYLLMFFIILSGTLVSKLNKVGFEEKSKLIKLELINQPIVKGDLTHYKVIYNGEIKKLKSPKKIDINENTIKASEYNGFLNLNLLKIKQSLTVP